MNSPYSIELHNPWKKKELRMYDTLFREHLQDCGHQAQLLQIDHIESILIFRLKFSRLQAVWKIKPYGIMAFSINSTTSPVILPVKFESINNPNFKSYYLRKDPDEDRFSWLPKEYLKLGEDGYIFARKFTIILESITLQDEQQLLFPFAERMKLNPDCNPDNSDLLKDLPYTIKDKIRGNPRELFYRHTELADFQGYQNQTFFSEDGCIISEVGVYGHLWQITSSDILSYKGFNIRCIDGGTQIGWAYMYGYSSKDRQLQNGGDLLMTANETIYAGKYTYKHIKELNPYRELNQEEDLPFQLGIVLPESGIRNPNRDQEGKCKGRHERKRADFIEVLQDRDGLDYEYFWYDDIQYLNNHRHSVELDLLYLRGLPFYARYGYKDDFSMDEKESWHNYAYRIIQTEYPPELLPEGIIRDTILNLYYQYPKTLPDFSEDIRNRFRDTDCFQESGL
jgi:hypothetical protein